MNIRYITFGAHSINSHASQAAYNRINLTCRGLNSHGVNTKIYEIFSSKFGKRWTHHFGHLICIFKTLSILFLSKTDDVIIIYDINPYHFLFKYFCKRTRIFIELHEYPPHLIYDSLPSKAIRLSKNFEKSLIYFEGIITCSYKLKDYYQKYTNENCKYLVLPLILDFKKFAGKSFEREDYIGYCGDFGNNKDGVPTLVKAFSIISDKFPNYKLFLAGGTNDNSVMASLNKLVSDLKLEQKVNFVGILNHDQMPEFLGKASILALARPNSLQAEGGFPSKIAEYLATGRPVVVTRVGELALYLRDNLNVFFSNSNQAEDFAICLDKVLSNYPNAIKVGQSGRYLAESFNFSKQTNIIKDFFMNK
jgi:glycosyltransferase involved in cell wall biosynthesis